MSLDDEKAYDLYVEGKAAMGRQDLADAADKFRRSARVSPHFKTLELLGECHLERGELADAVVYLAAAAGLNPKGFRARFLLAQALLAAGDRSGAAAHLEEAVRLNPNYRSAAELLEGLRAGPGVGS